ncbi:MAG: hypothetical protein U0525_03740 [Patescibacteria group bacterium]
MSNYTPLNISLLLRETGDIDPRFAKKKKGSFDKVFFPFSIMVLVLSLSFYAVKLMVDISSVPTQAETNVDPRQLMRDVEYRPTVAPSPTEVPEKMIAQLGSITIDPERVLDTAKIFYPDLAENDVKKMSKKSILEWAALKKYFDQNTAVQKRLTIDTEYPIATFGAILKDLDTLKRAYSGNKGAESQEEIDNLIREYQSNTTITLEP